MSFISPVLGDYFNDADEPKNNPNKYVYMGQMNRQKLIMSPQRNKILQIYVRVLWLRLAGKVHLYFEYLFRKS